jgi:hypothetical protein
MAPRKNRHSVQPGPRKKDVAVAGVAAEPQQLPLVLPLGPAWPHQPPEARIAQAEARRSEEEKSGATVIVIDLV